MERLNEEDFLKKMVESAAENFQDLEKMEKSSVPYDMREAALDAIKKVPRTPLNILDLLTSDTEMPMKLAPEDIGELAESGTWAKYFLDLSAIIVGDEMKKLHPEFIDIQSNRFEEFEWTERTNINSQSLLDTD